MRTFLVNGSRGLAILLGAAAASACFADPAQKPDPAKPAVLGAPKERERPAVTESEGVHRMEIFEGPNRTVRYFGSGVSSSERTTLNELERAENEMDYLNKLLTLRRLYVNNELTLQPQRLYVQEQLYGTQISYGRADWMGGFGYAPGGYGMGGAYPYVNAYGPFTSSYYGYGGGSGGYGGASASTNVVRSLANGMGDEGVLKNYISQVIAQQAVSPEYAAKVAQNYQTAQAKIAASPRLAQAFGLKKQDIVEAKGEGELERGPFTLMTKGGRKIDAERMGAKDDWYIYETATQRGQILKSEVTEIVGPKPGK
jgi:hypothetical protein